MGDDVQLIDEFSYAVETDSLPRVLAIRAIEVMGGQPYLKRLYHEYQAQNLPYEQFWDSAVQLLKLDVHMHGESIQQIPKTGRLVVVANHPYGVLDGIVICWLIAQVRPDFRILINSALCRIPEIEAHVLPISYDPAPETLRANLASRKQARLHLEEGGVLIVFPAGAVSATPRPFARKAVDLDWGTLTGQLVRRTKSPVLPLYFAGQNSQLFQLAYYISPIVRVALIFREVYRRIGKPFHGVVGKIIEFDELEKHLPPQNLVQHLRGRVMALQEKLPF